MTFVGELQTLVPTARWRAAYPAPLNTLPELIWRVLDVNEAKKAAAARRAKEHYKRNSKAICAHQRKKYHAKLAESPRAPKAAKLAPTKEERKHKNRTKAKRSYERNKSTIQERRRVPRWMSSGVVEFDTAPHKLATEGGGHDERKTSLQGISNDIRQAFAGRTPVEVALERVKAFGANHDRDGLIAVRERFEGIMEDINRYKHNVLNALGAGAHLAEAEQLGGPVSNAIWLLWDIEGGIIQGTPVEDMVSQIERGRLILRTPE
ncbi:hypothetical protein FA13DRAFT_1716737 [Coprinellus micaceus]|uniref:Uncharacterized protein n=1 Tax=Coprinellus micaceus TaxID=71717 RepID=A0A4Y7SJ01_COPMI|nr:hypothetical protein FA13DRAFT_1716737 [Coprinellus micaceus]